MFTRIVMGVAIMQGGLRVREQGVGQRDHHALPQDRGVPPLGASGQGHPLRCEMILPSLPGCLNEAD